MRFLSWLRHLTGDMEPARAGRTRRHTTRRKPAAFHIHLEPLEDRCCPSASYTVTDLGTLGGPSSYAYGINQAGQVVGYAGDGHPDYGHAFLWTQGATDGVPSNPQMKDLGTLGGTSTGRLPSSEGLGINNASQVVGEAYTASGVYHAFLWQNGSMTDLGTLGGSNSIAYGINPTSSHGVQVVGESDTATGPHAFLWQSSTGMIDLGPGYAFAINDAGQIVGQESDTGHAVLWQYAGHVLQVTDLGTLGGSTSIARAINAGGQVAGQSYLKNGTEYHAFVWTPTTPNGTKGKMKDLGTLNSNLTIKDSAAYGINDSGHVVGTSGQGVPAEEDAFYWPGTGSLQDLNGLVPANSMFLETAAGINDAGQIAGYDLGGASPHGWLLTPTSPAVQIGSSTASPNPVAAGGSVTLTASNITDSNANSTITQVAFYYFNSTDAEVLLGYGTQTSPGVWSLTFATTGWAPGSYTLYAQAKGNLGVFSEPLAITLMVL